jgi:lipopolysaccharide export system permease protein
MPILWRYLLNQFLKVLCFCIIAFIAILLTTRLDEIAHFASLAPQGRHIFLFILYQIPYILPIAIPISGLISAIILLQRLSSTHELTAMRAAGLGLRDILAPILFMALFLSITNFYIISELATHSHLSTNLMKNELRSINPLLLLNNKHLMRLKGVYFDTLGASRQGEYANDIILAMPNKENSRINLLLAKKLQASSSAFIGKQVSIITALHPGEETHFDNIMIENMGNVSTAIQDFSLILQKKVWTLNNDHLAMSLLLLRLKEEKNALTDAKEKNNFAEVKIIQKRINRCYSEIFRRISVALATFSFTLMGAAFGVRISRNKSNRGVFVVIVLGAFYLIAFFAGKAFDQNLFASFALYILPLLIIILLSIWTLNRVTKGIE